MVNNYNVSIDQKPVLDAVLKGKIRELTVERVGGANNPEGVNQFKKVVNSYNVTIDQKEESNDKKNRGNTASYGLDRLKRAAQSVHFAWFIRLA